MKTSGNNNSALAVAEREPIGLDPTPSTVPTTSASQRRWILIATSIALLAVMVSVSGLNVAQQALAADLGATQSQLLWIINGYTVALAATLLALGAAGDRLGRKTILLAGLALFSAANFVAAFAGDPTLLMGLRVATGVAAAMIMPATLSTITSSFPAEERGRAIGVWTGVAGGGGVLGLLTSAILIDIASWQWLFVAPIALAAVAALITVRFVPDTREASNARFDWGGSVLSVLAIGGLVLAIHEGPEQGWLEPITLASLFVGVAALLTFIRWERRIDEPLLDVSVFSNRTLSAGAFSLAVMFAVIFGLFVVMVQFLQAVLGLSAIQSALGLLPMIIMMMALSPNAPKISERLGYRRTMVASLTVMAGALGWLAMISSDPSYLDVLPGLVVVGAALGVAMTPSTTAITESLPAEKQGVASALNDTVREFGGAIGVALIGSVLASGYRSSIAETADTLPGELGQLAEEGIGGAYVAASQLGSDGLPVIEAAQAAFLDGWAGAMWLSAGMAIVAAVIAARMIPADA
jgi:EmrB/QacA subfamily drug resistance transporter